MPKQVFGEGPKDAKIALVGEALGEDEVRLGRPFVGPTGQLLDVLLRSIGTTRASYYITNVVKERPPGNKISHFIQFDNRGRYQGHTKEYEEYEDILYEELKNLGANVIVPLGGVPLYALTRKIGITKWRGSIIYSDVIGKKVIPTFHPSSALPFRNYLNQRIIMMDLLRVKKESLTPEVSLLERMLITKPPYCVCTEVLKDTIKYETPIAFDIEVVGNEVSCISFAHTRCASISIPLTKGGSDYFTLDQEREIWNLIAIVMKNPNIKKIAQNAIFDLSFLYRKYGIVANNVEDTMIAQGILAPDYPKSLAFLTSMYTKEPYYKDSGKDEIKIRGRGAKGVDDDFWRYNAKDSAVTYEIHPKIQKDLEKQGNLKTYQDQVALINPLIAMQDRGILVNTIALTNAREKAERAIKLLNDQLIQTVGYEINSGSPKQLMKYFYSELGIKPYIKSVVVNGVRVSRPTVDETALKRLSRRGYEAASILLQTRSISTMLSKYYKVRLTEDNRLTGAYRPVGTESGRLSSSADIFGYGTNNQNLPSSFKTFMISDPGYIMYSVDLGQAENRTVAYIAPEPIMQEAFEKGIDVHARTASMIFNIPEEDVSGEKGSAPNIGSGRMSQRFWGKKANHAFNYGQGADSFSLQCEIPRDQGTRIRNAYMRLYPGVVRYWEWIKSQLQADRTLIACSGRRRKFLGLWNDDLFRQAYSFIPQATVADKLNQSGLRFMYEDPLFYKCRLMICIHDSVGFQIPLSEPISYHARCLSSLKSSLELPIYWRTRQFSIPADISVGWNLGSGMTEINVPRDSVPQESITYSLERFLNERA